MSSGKKVIRNFFSLSIVNYANNFLPLLTMPIIARIIGPEKLGEINLAAAFVTYFSLIINYGFDLTGTRAIAKGAQDRAACNSIFNEVFSAKLFLFTLSSVVFVGCLFIVPTVAEEKALYLFSYFYCIAHVFTPNWLYQGMQDAHQMAIFQLIAKIIFTASILFVVQQRSDYAYQALLLSLSQVMVALFSFFWAINRYKFRVQLIRIKEIFTLLVKEKMIFFSMVVSSLNAITNTMVLGFIQNPTEVGYYTVGWKLITIMQSFISLPLLQALFPYMGECFGKSKEDGIMRIRKMAPLISVVTAMAGVFLWFAAPLLVTLLYGSEFAPGILVLRILGFIPLIQSMGDLFGIQTMINMKMDKQFFNIKLLGCFIGLVLNVLLSYWGGAQGTAWAWVLTEVCVTSILLYYLYSQGIRLIDYTYFRIAYFLQIFNALIRRRNQVIK